jgi:uncharacterized Ntn-hydrolase superfamily protein
MRQGTYSIVARDPETGELGAAVQSHWFSVGSLCTWARAGIGAVATQSVVEPAYGPDALDRLAEGIGAQQALGELLAADPLASVRQVAVVDAHGGVSVHTGADCIPCAGHAQGEHWSCQANMMARHTVPAAMSEAFAAATGDLAQRLLVALDAAEAEGGDVRGRQSAAIKVVAAAGRNSPHDDVVFDLRVEDHTDPVAELRRLVETKRAYDHVDAADQLAAAGDKEAALERYAAAHRALPGNEELTFWNGVALAANGREDEARDLLAPVLAAGNGWVELLRRLPEAGLLPEDAELIARLLGRS